MSLFQGYRDVTVKDSVKHIFLRSAMLFYGIWLFPGKMMARFYELTGRHLQWPDKSRCSVE